MGRLFWKFFLAFWLALIVAGVAVGTLVWLHQQRERSETTTLAAGPRAELALRSAAATLRHGGIEALRDWLGDETAVRGTQLVYAVGADGKDLLGRPVTPGQVELARSMSRSGERRAARAARFDERSGFLLFVPVDEAPAMRAGPRRGRRAEPALQVPPPMIAAIGLVSSIAFSALLAWYLTKPIRSLRRGFASVAGGALDTRIAPWMGGRNDELADLGRDFDQMTGQLQQLIASQRRLLHDVSHELRSPLARLQAAIGIARQNPERTAAMLDRIERETVRVDGLVGELLTLARLESGGDRAPRENVDIAELVASVVEDARFEARAAGRDVHFDDRSPPGAPTVAVHAETLHRAFENVIRNAIRFTPEGATVEVLVERRDASGAFVCRVSDRGPGVPGDELSAIFEPFHRARIDGPAQGYGLGLAIARRAIEMHGGGISAANRAGGGLVVTIELPA